MKKLPDDSYYPCFDYLRIALASVVMFGHDGLISWAPSGKLAVDVFFALSGWLIGGILIKTNINDLPRFYFNRALRIWIPYYIALILIIIASILKDPIDAKWFEFIVYKFTWVYNIFGPPQLQAYRDCMPLDGTGNHFWSVNAEEQFYLLAPVALVIFPNYGKQVVTWVLIVASLWLMNRYAPISLGVLAAIVHSRFPAILSNKFSQLLILALFIMASMGLASGVEAVSTPEYKAYAPIFSISLVLLLAKRGRKTLTATVLGGMSYPLYLNHWIGVFFFNLILEPFGLRESGVRYLLSALLNYAIALFLYWYIERKVLEMRKHLYSVRRGFIFTILAYVSIIVGLSFGVILNHSLNHVVISILFVVAAGLVIYSVSRVQSGGAIRLKSVEPS